MKNITTPLNVLIIEDNPPDKYLLKDLFTDTNIKVKRFFESETLERGLKILKEEKIDILFSDLSLPDSIGMDTVKGLVNEYYDLPIIVLTGLDDMEIGVQAIDLGAEDYIVKNSLDPLVLERSVLYALQRNRNKKQVSETMDMLRSYNQKLEQFAQIISHDLMSPIVATKGLVQLYQLEKKHNDFTKTVDEYFEDIAQNMNKMHMRLKSLMRTLVEQKETGSRFETIDLELFVSKVLNDVVNIYNNPEVNFTIDIEPDLTIVFVPDLLYSVFQNLISNAIKYRSPERQSQVDITLLPNGEMIHIQVKDNGIGIDLKNHEHRLFGIFQRFTEKVEGNGIGLHLIRNIIVSNGGKIEVESIVDEGTAFHIFLPRDRHF